MIIHATSEITLISLAQICFVFCVMRQVLQRSLTAARDMYGAQCCPNVTIDSACQSRAFVTFGLATMSRMHNEGD